MHASFPWVDIGSLCNNWYKFLMRIGVTPGNPACDSPIYCIFDAKEMRACSDK